MTPPIQTGFRASTSVSDFVACSTPGQDDNDPTEEPRRGRVGKQRIEDIGPLA
jgi:hypothetical protein